MVLTGGKSLMGAKNLNSYILFLMIAGSVFISCNKEENTIIFSKTKLAAVTNVRAFSYDGNSVALIWTRSTDSDKLDFVDVRITVKDGTSEYLTRVVSKTFSDSALIVSNLNEGTVYTFEIVSRAVTGSQSFISSDPVSIRWASARRLNGGDAVRVFEIASPDSTGLQFYDNASFGSRVLTNSSVTRPFMDVVVDSTASHSVIMKSGHLNRYGGGLRHTKFSTFDTLVSSLNIPRFEPPAPSTYTRDSIFIGPESITSGRMLFALTFDPNSNDSNYVRILCERSPNGSLLFGAQPRRYLSIKLSYQITRGIIYTKPQKRSDEVRD